MIGTVFIGQSYDQEGIFNINGAIFMIIACVSFVYQFSVMNVFCVEMPVLLREHYNGAYRVEIYYLTKQLADLPFYFTLPIILSSIIYWMVGFNDDMDRFLMFILIVIVLTQVVTGWGEKPIIYLSEITIIYVMFQINVCAGYLLSSIAGDIQLALALAPPAIILIMLFGGYFVNTE